MRSRATAAESLIEQSRALLVWLSELPEDAYARPTVLADWDVRMLVAHLVLVERGTVRVLGLPSPEKPLAPYAFVARYRPSVEAIAASTAETAGEHSGPELVVALGEAIAAVEAALTESHPPVVRAPRGPFRADDWIETRIIELVVHADDLNRTFPERDADPRGPLGAGPDDARPRRRCWPTPTRADRSRSASRRTRPCSAVWAIPARPTPAAPRPTWWRPTPLTFLRLATGRQSWADADRGRNGPRLRPSRRPLQRTTPVVLS